MGILDHTKLFRVLFCCGLVSYIFTPVLSYIDADCIANNLTNYGDCEHYVREQVNTFLATSRSYSSGTIPSIDGSAINMSVQMSFNHILSVDQVAGTVTLAVYLDLMWYDQYINWNVSATTNVTVIDTPSDSVWKPDFDMYNGVESLSDSLRDKPVTIYNDGFMWWSRPGTITYTCDFNLLYFPYDTQYCTAVFSNFQYTIDVVDIYPYSPAVVVNSNFKSSAFEVRSVSCTRSVETYYEVGDWEYSFLKYTVELHRYPHTYLDSAMFPIIVVTLMTIIVLYITDINARLGCAVTGLLTIIAIQVRMVDITLTLLIRILL
jgi:hypothetical protein